MITQTEQAEPMDGYILETPTPHYEIEPEPYLEIDLKEPVRVELS